MVIDLKMATNAPPIIDFSAAHGNDEERQKLVDQIRAACITQGFFQLVNHGVSSNLQDSILEQSRAVFALPLEVKEKYNKDQDGFNRGYERLRSQTFEKNAGGDLKEGFYFGKDLPLHASNVKARKFGQGPNKYPDEVQHPAKFRSTIDEYHSALSALAKTILSVLADTLSLDRSWFDDFTRDPVAVLRLLHYPSQDPDASANERGIGAHTDFGAITILLQDTVGGLQVWNRQNGTWVDVVPIPGAYVVNLGNMMMRWTNDRYLSNIHRVINKSGQERYSIPFFFSGNPDHRIECIESCKVNGVAKYDPITVGEWMAGRYADTYGTSKEKAIPELSAAEAVDANN